MAFSQTARSPRSRSFNPLDSLPFAEHIHLMGVAVPDPITFIVGPEWLNRPNLYPRQATLIKIIFLREDLFTEYDYQVLEEWERTYVNENGLEGLPPGTLIKMRLLRALGHKWFREVLLIMGRRAGKGHVTALAMAYVLWNYMAKGDPQQYYGVDRDKKLVALIFAGKRDQAKATVFGDLVNVITGSTCFVPYIAQDHAEKLSIYAPSDFIKIADKMNKGLLTERDQATFIIQPRESTVMAGRGPTSFAQCLDPATRVLTTDLVWVPIRDLSPGDRVIGVDEYPPDGSQRRMRDAEVQAVWKTFKAALRITFEDGTSVVCSPDHLWLSKELGKAGSTKWRSAGSLKPGNKIKHVVDPWEIDQTFEGGYLAGFYDGEGCVSGDHRRTGKSVFVTQNPGPTLDYVLGLLKEKGFNPQRYNGGSKVRAEQWTLDDVSEHLAFLGTFRPVRLMEKSRGVWKDVAMCGGKTPTGRQRAESHKTIIKIEPLPEQELVDITTSTRTFIAEGLISHNCFDEMAHIVATGANRSAEEVYNASKPSLDQFGKDAFIMEPSSPWQMMGQYYENWLHANEREVDGSFSYPDMLSIQLSSWAIYLDWERAAEIPLLPFDFIGDLGEYQFRDLPEFAPLKGAIQVYDEQMQREERANPDTFKVERRSRWATALDAYLNEEKVKEVFSPWVDRPAKYGPPELHMQVNGILAHTYKGHADPSKVNDKFGVALGHPEYAEDGTVHCVFDLLYHFDPIDFPDNIIDYEYVDDWIWDNIIQPFMPEEFTYDQYNSTSSIQKMQKRIREGRLAKRVQVFEKTVTRPYDWMVKENSKAAINLGLVHAPYYERAELELRYLQLVNGRVDHPSSGPVQSKDIADAMCEVIHTIVGEQVNNFLHKDLSEFRMGGTMQGGALPFPQSMQGGYGRETDERLAALSSFGKSRGRQEYTPSMNPGRKRYRRP